MKMTLRSADFSPEKHDGWHVLSAGPPPFDYVKAIERTFRCAAGGSPVQEVVIYTRLIH